MCGGQIIKTVSELFKISSNIGRDIQTNRCIDDIIETQDTREKKMTWLSQMSKIPQLLNSRIIKYIKWYKKITKGFQYNDQWLQIGNKQAMDSIQNVKKNISIIQGKV